MQQIYVAVGVGWAWLAGSGWLSDGDFCENIVKHYKDSELDGEDMINIYYDV